MESLGGLLFPLLILLLFIPIFLSGRKQRRQMQDMATLQSSLEVDDVVTTTSGLRGTVVDTSYAETVDLEIADGVVTTWLRAAIREKVLDAGTESTPDDASSLDAPAAPGIASTGSTASPRVDTPVDPAVGPAGTAGATGPAGDANGTTPRP